MPRTLRVLAALVVVGTAQAQEPSPAPPSSGPVFRTEVTSVEVDVFVTDASGNVVQGLTRDDVQVFEEGVRQEIATFTEVSLPIDRGPDDLPASDVATNESDLGRIYAIVLDEAQTDVRRSTAVRAAAREFIRRYMADGDRAAVVYTTDGARAGALFTADKALLQLAASRFTGRKLRSAVLERMAAIDHEKELPLTVPDPIEKALYARPGLETDPSDPVRAHNARASMAALESVARTLREVQGRRKSILFFSEGVDYDTLDVLGKVQKSAAEVARSMERAVATATWNNVAFYPIDPRGMVGAAGPDHIEAAAPPQDRTFGIDSQSLDRERRRSRDSLQALAAQTGGEAAVDVNDLTGAFERIVRANSHYYLLGYHPADFRPDGAFRRIEVKVTRPGVTVVARKGYVRPRADEPREVRPEPAAATGTSPELRELLESPWPRPGLPLAVAATAFRVSGRTATVAVTIELPGRALPFRREDDRAVNDVELSLLVLDDTGQVRGGERVLAQPRLTAQTLEKVQRTGLRFVRRLELPPGRYQLRVAAREAEHGRRGSVFYDLPVPDFSEDELAMSGVLVTSRKAALTLTPSPDEVMKGVLETPPTTARVFSSDDVLTAYAEVYDALEPAHDLDVATRVADADGREVFASSAKRAAAELKAAAGGVRYKVDIPLGQVPPGPYRLRIAATPTVGGKRVARELSFEVLASAAHPVVPDLPPPAAASARSGRGSSAAARIDRLEAWLAAVDRHQPGTPDAAAVMVRSWAPTALGELAVDLSVAVALIDDPGYPVMWVVDPRPGRPERAPYSAEEERRLRALAAATAVRCASAPGRPPDADPRRNAQRCANRLLKRGAILHTDAAVHLGDGAASADASDDPKRVRVRFRDGRQMGREDDSGHWELVRALLGNVAPDPAQDETVRLWYVATSAYGQYHERHTRHEDVGAQMFPNDAQMQFFAGCLHEMFASPRIQGLAHSLRLPAGTAHGIGSESSELGIAEERFRRAVERDPAFAEARLRLGRVLHLRGRHEQAARELQRAVTALSSGRSMEADDGLLAYYAEMFLGAASESLGRYEAARAAYARAAVLYPGAPSPFLALSRLALARSDRAGALEAVHEAMRADVQDRDDPLWRYHVVQGRGADAWFAKLHQSLAVEP